MKTLILVACLALPSCSMLAKAEELVDQAKVTYADAVAMYEEAKAKYAEVKEIAKQSDLDGSGKLDSLQELIAWGSGVLGLFGIGMAASANKKRKASTSVLFDQVGTLREKVAANTKAVGP